MTPETYVQIKSILGIIKTLEACAHYWHLLTKNQAKHIYFEKFAKDLNEHFDNLGELLLGVSNNYEDLEPSEGFHFPYIPISLFQDNIYQAVDYLDGVLSYEAPTEELALEDELVQLQKTLYRYMYLLRLN